MKGFNYYLAPATAFRQSHANDSAIWKMYDIHAVDVKRRDGKIYIGFENFEPELRYFSSKKNTKRWIDISNDFLLIFQNVSSFSPSEIFRALKHNLPHDFRLFIEDRGPGFVCYVEINCEDLKDWLTGCKEYLFSTLREP